MRWNGFQKLKKATLDRSAGISRELVLATIRSTGRRRRATTFGVVVDVIRWVRHLILSTGVGHVQYSAIRVADRKSCVLYFGAILGMANYLINMDRHTDRLLRMRGLFAELSLGFIRVKAIDAKELLPEYLHEYISCRPLVRQQVSPRYGIGHIGCLMSHFAAWQMIADGSDEVAAIFEDDIFLSPRISRFLQDFSWVPSNADIVHLEASDRGMRMSQAVTNIDGIAIRETFYNRWGTGGYLVTRDAAERLVDTPPRHHVCGPDVFLFNTRKSSVARSLRTFQVDPALCIQDKDRPTSLMESSTSHGLADHAQFGPFQWRRDNALYLMVRPAVRVVTRRRVVKFVEE